MKLNRREQKAESKLQEPLQAAHSPTNISSSSSIQFVDPVAQQGFEQLKPADVVLLSEKGQPKIPCVVIRVLEEVDPVLYHCLLLHGDTRRCQSFPRSRLMPFAMPYPETERMYELNRKNLELRRSFRLAEDIRMRRFECRDYFQCKCGYTVPFLYSQTPPPMFLPWKIPSLGAAN